MEAVRNRTYGGGLEPHLQIKLLPPYLIAAVKPGHDKESQQMVQIKGIRATMNHLPHYNYLNDGGVQLRVCFSCYQISNIQWGIWFMHQRQATSNQHQRQMVIYVLTSPHASLCQGSQYFAFIIFLQLLYLFEAIPNM